MRGSRSRRGLHPTFGHSPGANRWIFLVILLFNGSSRGGPGPAILTLLVAVAGFRRISAAIQRLLARIGQILRLL